MKYKPCFTENEILSQNGQVIKNPDGTISVYTVNQSLGLLVPKQMTKPCCEYLGMAGVYFDTDTQKCRWSVSTPCDVNTIFNLVLNPKGNDGSIFTVETNETSTLSVDFDYLFKFDCNTLTDFLNSGSSDGCDSILDVLENLSASLVINVIETTNSNIVNKNIYEEVFFEKIGVGNLYNYLKGGNINTGFFICGGESVSDTSCNIINIYDLKATANTQNCLIPLTQLLNGLFTESGLEASEITTTFKENVNADAFGPNWQHFRTEISDPAIIDDITNKKIKITLRLSGICIDTCVLIDNIELNKNSTIIDKNSIFLSKSPGFTLDRIIDNKKSWVNNTETTHRTFYISASDDTQQIRNTDYSINDERLLLNTKEIDLDIDIASAIETDVWNYIVDNPCLLTGNTIGTTFCSKDVLTVITGSTSSTAITSSTIVITGLCCPVTAITSDTVVITSSTTTYSCPVGYSATPANDGCVQINETGATFNGSGGTIVAGDDNGAYANYGAYFYPNVMNNGALPLYYTGNAQPLFDQTGGTITEMAINNIAPFWGNPLGNTTDGRLNNVGLSASSTEWLGFSYCVDIMTGGTYYIGLAADNLCRFTINGTMIVHFSSTTAQDNFKKWSVFEVELNSGKNIIEMEGRNDGSASAFGAEIYFPTDLATLTGATSTGASEANVIFTTADFVGQSWELGDTAGYSCPVGYVLDGCGTAFTCTQILEAPITATTTYSATSATTTGYCTDLSCVTYSVSATTGTTTGYTITSGVSATTVCQPKIYCCSEYCGDANLDIGGLLTSELSGASTVEDFEYFLTSELIDVKNRKSIQQYPTLRMLYDRYMNSPDYCNTNSSRFDYYEMNKFSNLIGNYWVDLIEQVVPATTIWGATRVYRNSIFDNQKFKYKSYSTLFGQNKFNGVKPLSPASGYSCNAEAITTVIMGNENDASKFFDENIEGVYNNIYTIQMNSGSEFFGTVSVVGPNGSSSNEGSGQVPNGSNGIDIILDINNIANLGVITDVGQVVDEINSGGIGNVFINDTPLETSSTGDITIYECGIKVNIINNNGVGTANVMGSNGPVTYLWNTSETTKSINGLSGGTYSVVVTDTSQPSCKAMATITIS